MIFTKAQKARYDKLIHKGGDHGSDGELWNRHDLHIIIHKLMKVNERNRAIGWRKGFADCQAMKTPNKARTRLSESGGKLPTKRSNRKVAKPAISG